MHDTKDEGLLLDERHHEMLAMVAAMYYEQDMTQNAIAEALGLSRVKVYRLLKEAKERNIVQITIDRPIKQDKQLEDDLKQTFSLTEALVLQSVTNDRLQSLRRLGSLAARYLEPLLEEGPTMAICLGSSTYEVIHAIRPDLQSNVRIAQAVGSLPFASHEYDSSALTRQLAQKLGGAALYLASPALADSVEAALVIRDQREIRRTLTAASKADIALVGVGNLDPATSGFVKAGLLRPEELEQMTARGAVGDMAARIFTMDGELFPCDFNQRVIGITLEELRQIPATVAVAMGTEKARAILGALRTRALNILCTDAHTAQRVLDLNRS